MVSDKASSRLHRILDFFKQGDGLRYIFPGNLPLAVEGDLGLGVPNSSSAAFEGGARAFEFAPMEVSVTVAAGVWAGIVRGGC